MVVVEAYALYCLGGGGVTGNAQLEGSSRQAQRLPEELAWMQAEGKHLKSPKRASLLFVQVAMNEDILNETVPITEPLLETVNGAFLLR